jgi:hypothetical protein
MATKRFLGLLEKVAGERLNEGVSVPKKKRNRSSRLDRHIVFIHSFINTKTHSNNPRAFSLRRLAGQVSKRESKPIWHTTVLKYLQRHNLMELFNAK